LYVAFPRHANFLAIVNMLNWACPGGNTKHTETLSDPCAEQLIIKLCQASRRQANKCNVYPNLQKCKEKKGLINDSLAEDGAKGEALSKVGGEGEPLRQQFQNTATPTGTHQEYNSSTKCQLCAALHKKQHLLRACSL
jgi:hypothetical protein